MMKLWIPVALAATTLGTPALAQHPHAHDPVEATRQRVKEIRAELRALERELTRFEPRDPALRLNLPQVYTPQAPRAQVRSLSMFIDEQGNVHRFEGAPQPQDAPRVGLFGMLNGGPDHGCDCGCACCESEAVHGQRQPAPPAHSFGGPNSHDAWAFNTGSGEVIFGHDGPHERVMIAEGRHAVPSTGMVFRSGGSGPHAFAFEGKVENHFEEAECEVIVECDVMTECEEIVECEEVIECEEEPNPSKIPSKIQWTTVGKPLPSGLDAEIEVEIESLIAELESGGHGKGKKVFQVTTSGGPHTLHQSVEAKNLGKHHAEHAGIDAEVAELLAVLEGGAPKPQQKQKQLAIVVEAKPAVSAEEAIDLEIEALLEELEEQPVIRDVEVKAAPKSQHKADASQKRIHELEAEVEELRSLVDSLIKELNRQ